MAPRGTTGCRLGPVPFTVRSSPGGLQLRCAGSDLARLGVPTWPSRATFQPQPLRRAITGCGSGPQAQDAGETGPAWGIACAAPAPRAGSRRARRPHTRALALGWQLAVRLAEHRLGSPLAILRRGAQQQRHSMSSMSPGAGRGKEGRPFRTNVNFLHQIF